MRPIDADVLYQKTEELEKQAREASRQAITEPTQEKWNTILAERSAFKYDITQMPTIDAVPVVHGKWLPYEWCTDGTWDKCSVCGVAHRTRDKYIGFMDRKEHVIQERLNYCPNCGARMDGGKDDEQV